MFQKHYWILIFILITLVILPDYAGAEIFGAKEKIYGISMSYGGEAKNDPLWHESGSCNWDMSSLHVLYGWRLQHFNLLLEGTVGRINLRHSDDITVMDATAYVRRDLIHYKRSSLFVRMGVGIGLWTDTPSHKFVSSPPLGVVQYGLGIQFPLKKKLQGKIETIFKHYSSIGSNGDSGCNSYILGIGIEW